MIALILNKISNASWKVLENDAKKMENFLLGLDEYLNYNFIFASITEKFRNSVIVEEAFKVSYNHLQRDRKLKFPILSNFSKHQEKRSNWNILIEN